MGRLEASQQVAQVVQETLHTHPVSLLLLAVLAGAQEVQELQHIILTSAQKPAGQLGLAQQEQWPLGLFG
jgi:hypothetical protein